MQGKLTGQENFHKNCLEISEERKITTDLRFKFRSCIFSLASPPKLKNLTMVVVCQPGLLDFQLRSCSRGSKYPGNSAISTQKPRELRSQAFSWRL